MNNQFRGPRFLIMITNVIWSRFNLLNFRVYNQCNLVLINHNNFNRYLINRLPTIVKVWLGLKLCEQ